MSFSLKCVFCLRVARIPPTLTELCSRLPVVSLIGNCAVSAAVSPPPRPLHAQALRFEFSSFSLLCF